MKKITMAAVLLLGCSGGIYAGNALEQLKGLSSDKVTLVPSAINIEAVAEDGMPKGLNTDKSAIPQLWLEPDAIKTKPDAFILNFFENHNGLQKAYTKEIQEKDFKVLRPAFNALYPVIGLEDPFLQALFKPELDSQNYRKIAGEFKKRTGQKMTLKQ